MIAPDIEFRGDSILISNIRDFRYAGGYSPTTQNYFDREYRFDDLQRIWLGLSHFGPGGLAHSFLSFEFSDNTYLVLSIEARLLDGDRYKPFAGMFRRYSKIHVLATEEDAIGVRSHETGQRVKLYPVYATQQRKAEMFRDLMQDVADASEQPEFYNTIFDNCLTNLLKHTALAENLSIADLRVLLPGRVDRLTYALDITPADIDFDEARQRARIKPGGFSPETSDFSTRIRCGWQGYDDFGYTLCADELTEIL
ncbi:MAG: DUF4105 domain-containing protein [Gammaproteobacteria bacterium]